MVASLQTRCQIYSIWLFMYNTNTALTSKTRCVYHKHIKKITAEKTVGHSAVINAVLYNMGKSSRMKSKTTKRKIFKQ